MDVSPNVATRPLARPLVCEPARPNALVRDLNDDVCSTRVEPELMNEMSVMLRPRTDDVASPRESEKTLKTDVCSPTTEAEPTEAVRYTV